MKNVYTIDFTSDIIRGAHNFGDRNLFENLRISEVNALIEEYTQKLGKPSFLVGMILWVDKNNDTYCFSIYKDGQRFEVTSLDDLKD